MKKYYFVDTGIRNAVIANFNRLDDRNDVGQLWENFMISERRKRNDHLRIRPNYYFWRTWDQKEVDLVEEYGGALNGFEFKWGEHTKVKAPAEWLESYDTATWTLINRENGLSFAVV
jgi:predicted AAA+ superfamily ATPase